MIEAVKKFLGFFAYIYFCYISKKNLIFLFHDITNSPCKYSLENNLFISKKNFLNIINHIDYHYKIIEPKSIINENINKDERSAMITFDDGFKSVYRNAIPILKKKKISSIIFLNSEVHNKNFFNISALILYLSKVREFSNYLKNYRVKKPYVLNLGPEILRKFLRSAYVKKIPKLKKKISRYQGNYLTSFDLYRLSKNTYVNFGNHLYNHWNCKALKKVELIKYYLKNKKNLKKYSSFLDFFAFTNGKYKSCYDLNTIKIINSMKPLKIFSSNNLSNPNVKNILLDRISINNYDYDINLLYFKVLKSEISKILSKYQSK